MSLKKVTGFEKPEIYTIEDYLDKAKTDPSCYSTAAERILKAIGEPEVIDTSTDQRLSRIFLNRTIKTYPAFKDFFGLEDTIERVVGFFRHASQGLEERKQVLYLLGPVGGGKSSLAERLKELMEQEPIYILGIKTKQGYTLSPVNESPLGILSYNKDAISEEYKIPSRYFNNLPSPWALKRLEEFEGDVTKFIVVKQNPSKLKQISIAKTEPGDENNQDISSLVGKVDIRKLEDYSQDDTDAYSYSGGLNKANQGMLEMVEIFKAPIKLLHPLLTATQEGNYNGTENIGSIPFNGVIISHSNQSEWATFKNNPKNEAFLDRIFTIKVPYCLRMDEEVKIYQKMLNGSSLGSANCAPETLPMLAKFSVLTRLVEPDNSNVYSKMRVYNGDNIRDTDPKAKSMQEYRDNSGQDEGMAGISTRFSFKILSQTLNFDPNEIAADPVQLMNVLENSIKREQLPKETEAKYMTYIKEYLGGKYKDYLIKELQSAYIESFQEYGQNLFNRYVEYADCWTQAIDYKDVETGQMLNREVLNSELEKIEKAAGIANPKDFRAEIVSFVLRYKAKHAGQTPKWDSFEKIKTVIEAKVFTSMEEMLPVISFGSKKDKDTQSKHDSFVQRMMEKGYSERQVRRLSEWIVRFSKNS